MSLALPETATVLVTVEPAVGAVRATVGGVVSLKVTVRLAVPVFPAASRAVTVTVLEPSWRAIGLVVQLLVPVAAPLPPRLFTHVTWVTPTLSPAVPPRLSGLALVVYVALPVGAVM